MSLNSRQLRSFLSEDFASAGAISPATRAQASAFIAKNRITVITPLDFSASRVLFWHEGSRDPTYVTGPWLPAPFSHRNDRCEPGNRRCDNHAPVRHRGSTAPVRRRKIGRAHV